MKELNEYRVGYTTQDETRREYVTVKAGDHGDAIKRVEEMIRRSGKLPKSIGTATQLTSDPHSAI